MLNLVKAQTERIDATFLEPACGSGNFLAEILRRKLTIAEKYKKIQLDYERNAVLAVASLYGIELLADNVEECRNRLLTIFSEHYQALFPNTFQQKCLSAVEHILSKNIVCSDALSMKTNDKTPIRFTEWKPIKNQIKRKEFSYENAVEEQHGHDIPPSDLGKQEFIAKPIKDYPIITFPRFLEELGND